MREGDSTENWEMGDAPPELVSIRGERHTEEIIFSQEIFNELL